MTGYESKRAAARDKMAQPAQEFVAWMTQARNFINLTEFTEEEAKLYGWLPVYVAPPQRSWVGLTEEEREDIALEVPLDAVLITEAKLKEKNT